MKLVSLAACASLLLACVGSEPSTEVVDENEEVAEETKDEGEQRPPPPPSTQVKPLSGYAIAN